MMDLYKLQIFNVVAEAGSFSAAADQLYMTQSAVSQHIKDLEASLGQRLFQRGRRGVSLTPHGEVLAAYSREIFDLAARAETALTNVDQLAGGKVSLGATPGVAIYIVPEWMHRFRARYPRLTVSLQTGITGEIATDILARRLDIGIIEGEVDDFAPARLASLVLETIEQKVVVGFRHPFWDRQTLTVDDLHRQTFIVRQQGSQSRIWLDQTLAQQGVTPVIAAEFDNLESMKRAVAVGTCLAILPAYVVQNEVEQKQLQALSIHGQPLTRTLKLIWNAQAHFTPVSRAFLNEMGDRYPPLAALLAT